MLRNIGLTLEAAGDWLDAQLDKLTTYRLVLYLLYVYVAAGIFFGFAGRLGFSGWHVATTAAWLVAVCRGVNWAISKFFNLPRNHESDLISALILALILTPAATAHDYLILAVAGGAAMASKYILVIYRRHLFNPAAVGAFITGAIFHHYASWWVGSESLAPFLIIGGVLILRKMKRFQMVGVFVTVYLLGDIFFNHVSNVHILWLAIIASPLIFFGDVMLLEPMTSPSAFRPSLLYASVVGVFYTISRLRVTPEEALLIGNGLTFLLAPNRSRLLKFVGHRQEANSIYSFLFRPPKKFKFQAGQYLEWTLPGVAADSRGNRRYITIASSPTEDDLMITVKIPERPSHFKQRLASLKHGDRILASQLAGEFTLPKDTGRKLAFVAGGVGITPFHSMIKYLLDTGQRLDVHLFYSVNSSSEIAYKNLLTESGRAGLESHFVATQPPPDWRGLSGPIDEKLIKANLPDYRQRLFYISGPQGFVASVKQSLLRLDVPHGNIKTDFFPGYN